MPEQEIKKSKKGYFSAIFWLALIIFAYFALRYLWSEFNYQQAKESAKSEFTNIESEIYQTPIKSSEIAKTDDKPLNQNEILLKQQLQIAELQNNFNALQADLAKFKANDSLSKIILSFVKLQDLFSGRQNYDSELQKLEVLSRADFALTGKIIKLKAALQNNPKNNQELSKEFVDLIPKIKSKQIEIESNGSWFGKVKATIASFIVIKRTNENSTKNDIESLLVRTNKAIENGRFDVALGNLEIIGNDYSEILANVKIDLQNANNFKQVSNEIYSYLEALSND